MASSFPDQIPVVVYVLQKLAPRTLLDVGKGFGKYGFLAHEYVGISATRRADPEKTLTEQSDITIDAVEVEPTFLWPHLSQIYRKVYVGRIESLYTTLPDYEVVLMADVIEHIEKGPALAVVRHFLMRGSKVVISTPKHLFAQHLYESEYEEHVSHWEPKDFAFAGFVDHQNVGLSRVFLLSETPCAIRGFGNRPLARVRRMARLIRSEF